MLIELFLGHMKGCYTLDCVYVCYGLMEALKQYHINTITSYHSKSVEILMPYSKRLRYFANSLQQGVKMSDGAVMSPDNKLVIVRCLN